MRVVHVNQKGHFELNWMWLPTFISQNVMLMNKLQQEWKERFAGGLLYSDESLDLLHNFVIKWLCEQFPFPGLEEYLRGIEKIEEIPDDAAVQQRPS